jgi:undecaprenyl-diphosphatase
VLHWVNQTFAHPVLDAFFGALYFVSNPIYHVPLLVLALLIKRWRHVTAPLLVTYVFTLALTTLLQEAVGRVRPDPAQFRLILAQPAFFSYPSGHASTAFALAGLIGLRRRSAPAWLAGLAWGALVAFGRLVLAHHYPSDVLAGAVFGLCCATTCHGLLNRKQSALRRVSALFWVQLALFGLATHMAYLGILPWHLLRWPYADKVLHAVLIGAIGFWLNLRLGGRRLLGALPLGIALALGGALIEELFQGLSPLRTFDITDALADLLGSLIAWVLSARLLRGAIIAREHD